MSSDTETADKRDTTTQAASGQPDVVQGVAERRIRGRYKRAKKIPSDLTESQKAEVLSLKARGVSNRTISIQFGMREQSLNKFMRQYEGLFAEMQNIGQYRDLRADLLGAAHSRMLKFATKEKKLDEAPLGQLATAMDKLYKQERLERGLSTDNQSSKSYSEIVHTSTNSNTIDPTDD